VDIPMDRNRRWRKTLAMALALALSAAGISFGAGQIEPGSALAGRIAAELKVQVVTASGTKVVPFPQVVPDGIRSRTQKSPPIPWREIKTVRYRGPATWTGIWVGAGAGLAFGIASCGGLSTDLGALTWYGRALLLTSSVAAGALTGALIGSLLPKWKTLYAAGAPAPALRLSIAPAPGGGAMTMALAF
jgi:hypothetical protein